MHLLRAYPKNARLQLLLYRRASEAEVRADLRPGSRKRARSTDEPARPLSDLVSDLGCDRGLLRVGLFFVDGARRSTAQISSAVPG